MTTQTFPVSWSKWIKAITCMAVACLTFLTCYICFNPTPLSTKITMLAIDMVLFISAGISCPLKFQLTTNSLMLRMLIGKKEWKYSDIDMAHIYEEPDFSWKLFTTFGAFGISGTFRTAMLGRFTAYVGDKDKTFLMTTKGKAPGKYLLSVNDPEAFLEELNKRLGKNVL